MLSEAHREAEAFSVPEISNLSFRCFEAAMATTTAAPPRQLSDKEADIQMMLAAEVHLGTKNCDFQMERYVFKRRNDGSNPPPT